MVISSCHVVVRMKGVGDDDLRKSYVAEHSKLQDFGMLGSSVVSLWYSKDTGFHYVVFEFVVVFVADKARTRKLCLARVNFLTNKEEDEQLDPGVQLPTDAQEVKP